MDEECYPGEATVIPQPAWNMAQKGEAGKQVSEILVSSEWSSVVRGSSYISTSGCRKFKTLGLSMMYDSELLGLLVKNAEVILSKGLRGGCVDHTLRNLCNGSEPPG